MFSLSYQISNLLEKMSSPDKDYRFMATNDLMIELKKDSITLDDDTERKVVKTLLRLLEDKNGEVQNLAVRCLAPLVHKIKMLQLETVVDTLCSNIESQNEQLRDVSSIALKTVMAELPGGVSPASMLCIKRVMPRLVEGLCVDNKTDVSVKLEILDILSNLILRFGRTYALSFEDIDRAIFLQMQKERQALRKRSINALGYLVEVVSNEHYDCIVQKIFNGCEENSGNLNNLRTYVSATNSICRSSSARFAAFLPKFVPIFVQYCTETDDDELKEACLQAFETFTYRCTKEISPFLDSIIDVVSKFITYDPNYQYDDVHEENNVELNSNEMETDDKDSEDGDGSDQDEYSDDDDLSWKVRRASAKCIETVITYHSDKLYDNYIKLGPLLIKRFKEREDNVKYDIFQAYSALLKQTTRFFPDSFVNNQHSLNTINIEADGISLESFENLLKEEFGPEQHKIFNALRVQTPSLVKAIHTQIKTKNLRTKQQCFILLSNLLRSLPCALSNYFQHFITPVQSTLIDKLADGNMKINALHFVLIALNSHHPTTLHPFVGALTPLVVNAVQDPFYKIASEALVVAQLLIRILRLPADGCGKSFPYSPYVKQLYSAIVAKLKITDIDQEVKEKTISAAGLLISVFADEESVRLKECLPLLLDRLRNEMTRCVTVKAFNAIVTSSLKIDLSAFLSDLLFFLADFLRKNQRTLRILTLILLESLVIRYSQGGLENTGLLRVVHEISPLISEHDLQISLLSIKFITDVVNAYPDQISDSLSDIFLALVHLTQSSLLHGATLSAALNLFVAIVKSPLPNKPTFEDSLDQLSSAAYKCKSHILHRQAYIGMAKAIAAITRAFSDLNKAKKLIVKLDNFLQSGPGKTIESDSIKLFAILTLGELGRIYYDAFVSTQIEPELLIMESFNSHSEDVKAASSYALGSLAVGNLEKFLPFLLQEITQNPKRQYQLLHALKEIISSESAEESSLPKSSSYELFTSKISEIWKVLVQHCDCTEEGIRNIVAECLGKLCLIDAKNLLPHLLVIVESDLARMRRTAVNAARFMIVDHPIPVDDILRPIMGQFLKTIQDPDLQVRRVAIVTLNSAAHNKPKLIRDCLPNLLPHLYSETIIKKELVYEVEMGPFKHVVDDGLDLRKAAFECMYTLAEQFLDKIDIFDYMNHVENGLKDQHDIKLLTFLMLIRLSLKCPFQVTQRIDRLCELIKPQLLLRPKPNAVKQENEKQDELKRAAIRACAALKQIPSHEGSQKMNELLEIIRVNPDLAKMLEDLERDSTRQCFDYLMDSTD